MKIQDIISNAYNSDAIGAKQSIYEAISERAMNFLDVKKNDIAIDLFGDVGSMDINESSDSLEEGAVHPADAHRILTQTGGVDTDHFALSGEDVRERMKLAKKHGYVAKGDSPTGRSKFYRTSLHLQRQAAKYKQNEEVEQLDELSKGTLGSYIKKASFDKSMASFRQGKAIGNAGAYHKNPDKVTARKEAYRDEKRQKGIETAVNKLTKEESEQLEESKLHPVKHFDLDDSNKPTLTNRKDSRYTVTKEYTGHPSGEPQHVVRFMDKYVDEFPDHASAAKHAQQHSIHRLTSDIKNIKNDSKILRKEEFEQLDELSKNTLGNYIKKAASVIDQSSYKQGRWNAGKDDDKKYWDAEKQRYRRTKGLGLAVNKLTKEEFEQLDEELSHNAYKLVVHADNDRDLYKSSHVPVAKNLEKKAKAGKYDHEKAKKLWKFHIDRVADSYAKEYGKPGQKGHHIFSVADRKEAASHLADKHKGEMELGNFQV